MSACRVKQGEIKTHSPIRPVARSVGIVFTTGLDTDRLFPNLQNLADLKKHRHGPFSVVRGSIPVRGGFGAKGESGMSLCRVRDKRLNEHGAVAASMILDHNGPKLVHQRTDRPGPGLL